MSATIPGNAIADDVVSDLDDNAAVPLPSFNYNLLEPELAAEAREVAERIRTRLKSSYLATGHDLIGIKDRLGHGNFGRWLSAEFGMTPRSAERYMSAARLQIENSDIMSDLPAATIEALSAPSLPEAVRATCVERIRSGLAMSPRDVRQAALAAKDATQRAERERLPKSKGARSQAIADRDAKQRQDEVRHQRAMRDRHLLIELIVEQLGDKRAEALGLLNRLKNWSIDDMLREALDLRVGGL